MQIFSKSEALKDWRNLQKKDIGFVPTMGALHDGHLSLIRKAKKENDLVICSIFVNPTQFNNQNDLKKYPRNTHADKLLLEKEDCDILFIPDTNDMYPDELKSEDYDFGDLERIMEAKFRPGHFQGVATVVHKFFDLIKPTRAYFGEKDFQQLQVIRSLVKQKDLEVEIVACPTAREKNGLARSSRNERLDPKQREKASIIYRSLLQARDNHSEQSLGSTIHNIEAEFNKLIDVELEYVQFVDESSLSSLEKWNDAEHVRGFIAAYFGEVRLIDNLLIF